MFVYTMSGFLSAVSGIILLSRLVSAQPSAGLGQELPVIAASIIGGTSLVGGEGTAFGAVLGAAIVGVLENGIVLLGSTPMPSRWSPGRLFCWPSASTSGRSGGGSAAHNVAGRGVSEAGGEESRSSQPCWRWTEMLRFAQHDRWWHGV